MSVSKPYDFVVIGGGITGAATAYKLGLKYPKKSIALIEKEKVPASHQTGRNSGVIHSGIYYRPGSMKALNCRVGRDQLVQFAKEQKIAHRICGKMIVAVSQDEVPVLESIFENGTKNNTPGIRYLDSDEIMEREPFIKGIKGVWVPSAGIIDFVAVVNKFVSLMLASNSDNRVHFGQKVIGLHREQGVTVVKSEDAVYRGCRVIVCGGLFSDRLAAMDQVELDMKIVGFRGDYYKLTDKASHMVNNLVYPVPDPKYPFLGVHFTPMIGGEVECGPNAVFTFKREGYSKFSFSLRDSWDALTYSGTLKLFARNWRKGLEEYRRSFSKNLFVRELQKMMPSISKDDITATRSGVRAQAIGPQGQLIDDFKIVKHKGTIHVINAPSPAATACLAIADHILETLDHRESS